MKPKQHNKQKDILFILISTFVVVVIWIGSNLHHIWATSTIKEDLQLKLTPIEGSFDTATIQKLKTRERVNPLYERQATPSTPTPVVSLSPTPTDTSRFAPTDIPVSRLGL